MCFFNLNKLTFLIFVLLYTETKCHCRQSYMTFCDNLNDLNKYRVENWTELVIGHETDDSSQLSAIDYNSISMDRFENLASLIIVRQIRDIKTYTFAGVEAEDFSELVLLKLYGNEIKRIRFTTFDNLKVKKLSLANNSIEYIHKEAFYNCEIGIIDLADNKLESVEVDVFTEEFLGNTTKELILRNNRLESLQPKCFPSSLEVLNLDYNNLNYLDYGIFENLVNLKELSLSHNKISSLPGLAQLKEIWRLDFSHNQILSVKEADLNQLSQLEVLDLGHNKMSYPLTFNKFNFPRRYPSLQISLAFNKLTHLTLEDDSFKDHIVFLYGNPWDCRCWCILEKFMKDNKVKRNQCDTEHFGSGQVPYCINNVDMDCNKKQFRHPNYTTPEIEDFLSVVKRQESVFSCDLFPRRL